MTDESGADASAPNVYTTISDYEGELGVPEGFFKSLLNEDDWSFVIKLHALFEAAANYILTKKIGIPELEDSISHFEFSGARSGKTKLLQQMGVLNKQQITFLNKLSELRNNLVHRVSNINFSFADYVEKMNKDQKRSFVNSFGYDVKEKIEFSGKSIEKRIFVPENPKISIYISSSDTLACLLLEEQFITLHQRMQKEKDRQLEQYHSLAKALRGTN